MSLFGRIGSGLGLAARVLVGRADYSEYDAAKSFTEIGWGDSSSDGLGGVVRNTRAWLECFRTHPRVQAAVNRIATDVGKTRWLLLEDDPSTGKPREVKDHPLLTLMAAPWVRSAGGSWSTLLWMTAAYLELDGNAFWRMRWKPGKPKTGPPTEVWPISPHLVASVPCKGQPYYLLSSACGEEALDRLGPDEIIWFRKPNLLSPNGKGAGAVQALDDEVSQDNWAAKYNNMWFRNGARPDLLVSLAGDAKSSDQKRVQEQWNSRHGGIWNAFKVAFLTGDAKVHSLGTSHKDMEWAEGRKLLRDIIFQTLGIPPEILGVIENSNRATAEAALYIYALQCILPRVTSLCEDLNRLLVPMFSAAHGRPVYLGFESPVRETEEFRLERAERLFKAGAISRDECRDATGWDPMGGERGEEILQPLNMLAVGPNDPRPDTRKSAGEKSADSESRGPRPERKPTRRNTVRVHAMRGGVMIDFEMERAA